MWNVRDFPNNGSGRYPTYPRPPFTAMGLHTSLSRTFMSIVLTPEVGIPLSVDMPYSDLRVRAEAACNTALLLAEHGLDVNPNKEDKDDAAALAIEYAENPEKDI